MSIEVRNLVKRFGSHLAVDDVSFDVGTGELVACLGPSGSGKSAGRELPAGSWDSLQRRAWLTPSPSSLRQKRDHSRNNPIKRGLGDESEHRRWSRARCYVGRTGMVLVLTD